MLSGEVTTRCVFVNLSTASLGNTLSKIVK